MKRKFTKFLIEWKNKEQRLPLIVRGARQVGKTYTINEFGINYFEHFFSINFEKSEIYKKCFDSMEPSLIISEIELISKEKIIPGKTLLFLDEIQACSKALQSLRYFKEKMPNLHVIAAGSLLEFAINDGNFSFPVGRVQFARLYPLSFEEFLLAIGDENILQKFDSYNLQNLPPDSIHDYLINRINEYFIVGGMPLAVDTYLNTKKFLEARYIQKALWDSFEGDFGKYAEKHQHRLLKKIFTEAPKLIGSHVKYCRIDPDIPNPARDVKQALELLELAGLVHYVYATSGGELPLILHMKESIFKLMFLDIGMVEQAMNIDPNYSNMMLGPLAEQFIAQEMLAYQDPVLNEKLFFWTREKSSAEVDYLYVNNGKVYPIEVKSGKVGKLKSLYIFIEEKKVPFGIKISQEKLTFDKNILSVPFYLFSRIHRLIDLMNV